MGRRNEYSDAPGPWLTTQRATSERSPGKPKGNAGVLSSGAAWPHLGGAPVKLCFPSDSSGVSAIRCQAAWRQGSLLGEMVLQ